MKRLEEKKCIFCNDEVLHEYLLYEDKDFRIICDANPLLEGHILLTPKDHIITMGSLNENKFREYKKLYQKVKNFIEKNYGEVGIFEHGIVGQTVFHAHTHFLPFDFETSEIISQTNYLREISSLEDVQKEFLKKGKYLFFENKNQLYLVDTKLGFPRFFRDIYADLLNANEKANWKQAKERKTILTDFKEDVSTFKKRWNKYHQ